MKYLSLSFFLALFVLFPSIGLAYDTDLAERLHGRILLQVEDHGEAWYIRSNDSKRYYMKDGAAAYEMMRFFSLGISDGDLAKIPQVANTTEMNESSSACASNALANRLKGEILLRVEQRGEAYYIDPVKCRAIYMEDGAAAYQIMRYLGLGIVNSDLAKIEVGVMEGQAPIAEIPTETITSLPWTADLGFLRFGQLTQVGRVEFDAPGGYVRPHSGPFSWSFVEGQEGVYDWSYVDFVVRHWQEKRQVILATIWPFVDWDQQACHSNEPSVSGGTFGELGEYRYAPCDEAAYAAWVRALVDRYDGDGANDMPGLAYAIRYWEVLNEPSMQGAELTFFQEEPEVYADLFLTTAAVIQAEDENALILPAGQSGMMQEAKDYWNRVLPLIAGSFDYGNIHSISSSDQFYAEEYRAYLDSFGLSGTPFWITEGLVGDMSQPNMSDDTAARLAFTSYVNAFANGADLIINVGAHDPTGGPGDIAQGTFDLMTEVIGAFTEAERISDGVVRFGTHEGPTFALWDNALVPVELQGEVDVYTYNGTYYSADARAVLANVPLFVTQN